MTYLSVETENARLEQIANDYKKKGYEVSIRPNRNELPDFLLKYSPDLIVKNLNESVVIEVKARSSFGSDMQLQELAKTIQNYPGWRLELVITKSETDKFESDVTELDLTKRINEVKKLKKAGYNDAALLLVWGAVEASLRELAKREDVELERPSPAYIIKYLTSLGLIEEEDYQTLWQAMNYRNAVAHGYKAPDTEHDLVEKLIGITNRIIAHT